MKKPAKKVTVAGAQEIKKGKAADASAPSTALVSLRELAPLPVPRKPVPALKIKSDDDLAIANAALVERQHLLDVLEADYKEIAGPLNTGLRKLQEKRRAQRDPLQAEIDTITAMITAYSIEQTAKQRQLAEKEALKLERKGDVDSAALARIEGAEAVKPTLDGFTYVDRWVGTVTDAASVPAYFNGIELRTIDQAALNKLATMAHEKLSIPGVKAEQQRDLRRKAGC